ncbi:MAG: M48 family metalloprotease, partial [Acidobacteriota bacterium]
SRSGADAVEGVLEMRAKHSMTRQIMAMGLAGLLIWTPVAAATLDNVERPPLKALVNGPYLLILEKAADLEFTRKEMAALKKELKREEKSEKKRLKDEQKDLEKQLKALRDGLEDLNKKRSRDTDLMRIERSAVHCEIQSLETQLEGKKTEREQGLPLAFENRFAKLDLIQQWPGRKKGIEETLASGRARERRYGDVEDIGVRVLKKGQEKDTITGEEAVRDMKASGLMPPPLENDEVTHYIDRLSGKIAANSDLSVPLKVTVLDSDEINAFALPGGFLYVNAGLIEKAETESELAGVIAHEIAHVTARHGARLMGKANIANIFLQAAQVAALIFTGGVVGAGTYYALQYGFFGLGMALNLTLLGVSRDYEEEADQLGAQYAWNAGYDPRGFITFFDKMASEEGYVKSASFFRTHPPFFERIVGTFSEIEYLPEKDDLRVDSQEFQQVKERLKEVNEDGVTHRERPRLGRTSDCEAGRTFP